MKRIQLFLIRHLTALVEISMWATIVFLAVFTFLAMGFQALLEQFVMVGGFAVFGILAVTLVVYVHDLIQNGRDSTDDSNDRD